MISEREKAFRIALNHFPELGPVRTRLLIEFFGSIESLWQAKHQEFSQIPKIPQRVFEAFLQFRQQHDPFELAEQVQAKGLQCVFLGETDYPLQLSQIYDPPYVLYYRGKNSWHQLQRCIAIIGTRHPTSYGLKMAHRLAEVLSEQKISVVSGMALGIDAAAHEGALAASGLTVAVLGSGADVATPPSHQGLYERICDSGMVVSEFPPGFMPQHWTFPMRNRIVSGLSQGIVVVEAGIKSGTLITVDCANEQGREVFAMPGPITSEQSKGTHTLIQQGAHLLTHPDEILAALNWQKTNLPEDQEAIISQSERLISLTKPEQVIYEVLSTHPQHIDHINDQVSKLMNQAPHQITSLLTILELKGLAEQLPGKLYKKTL